MKYFKGIIIFMLVFISYESWSQSTDKVEMADILRRDGKIYTVVVGVVTILTAMIILLVRVDRKLFKLESLIRKEDSKSK